MSSDETDPDEASPSFPVLDERPLSFVGRRFLRGARRDPGELPDPGPASVLVFRNGSRYVVFEEPGHLTGAEEPVVDATAVFLVDTRARAFTIHFPLPSASPADDFTVRVTFRGQVTDAGRAAEGGPLDMSGHLKRYLQQDPKLAKLGSQYSVEDIATVRDLVISRIEAYCEFNPVELPGLAVSFASAAVLTPRELRRHNQQIRDERWRQQFEELHDAGEDRSIRRHQALVDDGPAALTALGLTRGETSASDAIINARADEQRRQDKFAEAFRILQENGSADFIDIDPTEMVTAYLEKLTGEPVSRRRQASLRGQDSGRREAISTSGESSDEEAPDEAGLDE